MNNNNNNIKNLTKLVSIENAINMYFESVKEHEQETLNIISEFNSELLSVMHKRNISTIDKVRPKHLMFLIANLASKYGDNSLPMFTWLTKDLFEMVTFLEIIEPENNPANILDIVFPNKPFIILSLYDFQASKFLSQQ